jgi:mannose-6-phosphate isomerase-like protein (cupin superfamily)
MTETTYGDIYIINIENETIGNKFFRKVLYTSGNQQLVVMSIKPKEDIPFEIHPNNDQFIRIEKGEGMLYTGPNKESKYELSDGVAFIVPANTWHQVVNTSETNDLKLYTLYSPPHHPKGKIDINRPKQSGGNYNLKKDSQKKFMEHKGRNFMY